MNKSTRLLLYIIMLAAMALICVCFLHYISLNRQYLDFDRQLSESRETWESIAAEKEALQVSLAEKKNELKEAELSYRESTERAEELKAEIEQLTEEIDNLKQNNASRRD